MRTVVATLAATLALAGAAPAAKAPKVVHFTATSTVHSSDGASFAGAFQSRRLGSGSVRYTSKPAGDASVTRWRARLRSGTLKGTARTTLTPGATDMDPATIDGARNVTGGRAHSVASRATSW